MPTILAEGEQLTVKLVPGLLTTVAATPPTEIPASRETGLLHLPFGVNPRYLGSYLPGAFCACISAVCASSRALTRANPSPFARFSAAFAPAASPASSSRRLRYA